MNEIVSDVSNNEGNFNEITRHKLNVEKIPECRICLEYFRAEEANNKLISPCKCTGSLKNVHETCLQEWISKIVNKSHKKISSGKAHIFCQICKSKIYFKTLKTLTCKTKEQIKESFRDNLKTFILLMLLLLTNLGFFSALLNYLLFVGFTILQSNNVVLVSLIIAGQVIFSIVSIVTLVCIINKYFLSRKFVILQIVNSYASDQNLMAQPQNIGMPTVAVENHENSQVNVDGK